ncbi:MAG TPA: hypothetical protein VHZ55_20950 [Bryobacteraceae bacterium]|nr:hypothetical protein [Bryobacteraceae bacterium]
MFRRQFANAQVSQGKFTLPVETHWGKVILPPGPYSFTLDHLSPNGIITLRARGRAAMIPVTAGITSIRRSERSSLLLVTQDGETSVRTLNLGHCGLAFQYHAPQAKTPVLAHLAAHDQSVLISDMKKMQTRP